MTSELVGVREFKIKLDKLKGAAAGKALKSATTSAMLPAYRAAQRGAPQGTKAHIVGYQKGRPSSGKWVSPGYASRSVRRRVQIKWETRVRVGVGVTQSAYYAVNFIELGWRPGRRSEAVRKDSHLFTSLGDEHLARLGDTRQKIPARPWLEPAMTNNREAVLALFKKRLKKAIEIQTKLGNRRRFGRRF